MYEILTKEELLDRQARFRAALDMFAPGWDTAVIVGRVNQYYLEGTMQDGILIFKRGGGAYYFIRRSYERAKTSRLLTIYTKWRATVTWLRRPERISKYIYRNRDSNALIG